VRLWPRAVEGADEGEGGDSGGDGGLAARRAVVRWSWRLFRREWRQQVLVLTLITVAVAVTVAGATAAYNMAPSGDDEFGRASHSLVVDAGDPAQAAVEVAAIEAWFDTTEQIRSEVVAVSGSVEDVVLRAQAPDGPFAASLLALVDGRYPAAGDEVALTDDVAETFGVGVGSTVEIGRRERSVVGVVENPEDLSEEFALVAPTAPLRPGTVEVLVDTTDERIEARPPSGSTAESFVDARGSGPGERGTAVLVAYLVATVVLLLVALVAAAGFVVMAQRRQRQIGLLAATGATHRHLRLVMVANGAAVGAAAAVVGTAAGLLIWVAIAPAVETAAGRRIARFDVPWWLIAVGMLLAVLTATAASWWPARTVARVSMIAALTERPPPPRPVHRSAVTAGAALVAGTAAIWWADPNRPPVRAQPLRDIVMVAGVVAITIGVLFLAPTALAAVGRAARRLPVTGRLALRDLARFQARSAMALGAVSLAIGIPIAIVITSTAGEASAQEGNLSDRDLLFRIGDAEGDMVEDVPAAEVDAMTADVDALAAEHDGASVAPLEMAMEPDAEEIPGFDVRQAVALGIPDDDGDSFRDVPAFLATPELLAHLGVDPARVDADADVLTVRSEPLYFLTRARRSDPELATRRAVLDVPAYSSAPTTLITPESVERQGWDTVPVGWLVTAPSALSADEVREARDRAAAAGLTVEARRESSTTSLRRVAIGAGSLLALAVVAMTVGLVRSEVARDLRTLTATGATGGVRRRLTAWTAGALALLGVALGALGAYLALAAGYARELGELGDVPFGELAVIAAGVPLLAAGAGWLLGGREPASLVRAET
jgi:putative ABC transport system permease protein